MPPIFPFPDHQACLCPGALALALPSIWNALIVPSYLVDKDLLILWGHFVKFPCTSPSSFRGLFGQELWSHDSVGCIPEWDVNSGRARPIPEKLGISWAHLGHLDCVLGAGPFPPTKSEPWLLKKKKNPFLWVKAGVASEGFLF